MTHSTINLLPALGTYASMLYIAKTKLNVTKLSSRQLRQSRQQCNIWAKKSFFKLWTREQVPKIVWQEAASTFCQPSRRRMNSSDLNSI